MGSARCPAPFFAHGSKRYALSTSLWYVRLKRSMYAVGLPMLNEAVHRHLNDCIQAVRAAASGRVLPIDANESGRSIANLSTLTVDNRE